MSDHPLAAKLLEDHFTATAALIALRAFASVLLGGLCACSSTAENSDMSKERERVEHALCSKQTLQEAESVLAVLKFDPIVDRSQSRLTSFRRYGSAGLFVDNAILINVEFDAAKRMTKCDVRAVVVH